MRRRLLAWLSRALVALALLLVLALWRMPEVYAWRWWWNEGKPSMTVAPLTPRSELRWIDDYYVVADLGQKTFAIGEPRYGQCNFSYLIVGSTRALLFDTGPGVRNIQTAVRTLTDLPVMAMPSHLHFDHTGNLAHFSDVALPDLPALRAQVHDGWFSLGFYQFLGFVEGFKRPSFQVSHWVPSGGDIDLGDRKVVLVSVPGHTPDSVVLMDRRANRLFAGDFIYPSDIYAFLPGANLHDYAESARRVLALIDDQTAVYGAHGCDRLPMVDLPVLRRTDVGDLERALVVAESSSAAAKGWYPREFAVNDRMKLLAKYPWMSR